MADNKEFLIRVKADIKRATKDLKTVSSEISKTSKSSASAKTEVKKLGEGFDFLTKAAGAYFAFDISKRLVLQADAYNVLQQRIKTATRETGDYVKVSQQLFDVTQANGTQLKTTVSLFQNLARSAPELQATNDEMIQLTDLVQQLGIISGASESSLNSGLLQFSQGLSAGVFRAEEFNSLLENIPEVANRIAKGMGKTTGELRKAVVDGKVLSKDVFESLIKQAPEIADQFKEIPLSVERAGTSLNTSLTKMVAKLDKSLGLTTSIANAMNSWSQAIDRLDGNPLVEQREDLKKYQDELKHTTEQVNILKASLSENSTLAEDGRAALEFGLINISSADKSAKLLDDLQQRVTDIRSKMQKIIDDVTAPEATAGIEKTTSNEPAIDPKQLEKINAINDALKQQAETFGKASEEVALYKLELLGADEAQLQLAQNTINTIDAQKKANDLFLEAEQIYKDTRTEQEQLAASLQNLDSLLEKGAIDWDTYSRAVFNANEEFDSLADAGDKSMDKLIAATRGWGAQFTNTLADMVQQGKLDFKSLADSIINDLLRIMIQQQITAPLFAGLRIPGFSAGTNHTGGLAGTGPSKLVNPAVFLNAPKYHTGGLAGLKTNEVPAILERGEEVLTRNDPRHQFNQGGGSVKVEIENKGTPSEINSAETSIDVDGMVVKVIMDDHRRGGPIRQLFKGGS